MSLLGLQHYFIAINLLQIYWIHLVHLFVDLSRNFWECHIPVGQNRGVWRACRRLCYIRQDVPSPLALVLSWWQCVVCHWQSRSRNGLSTRSGWRWWRSISRQRRCGGKRQNVPTNRRKRRNASSFNSRTWVVAAPGDQMIRHQVHRVPRRRQSRQRLSRRLRLVVAVGCLCNYSTGPTLLMCCVTSIGNESCVVCVCVCVCACSVGIIPT